MLGYVCQYNHEHHYDIAAQVEEILNFIAQSTAIEGMISTKSLFKLSTGATKLRPYFKQFESNGVFAKIIRKILLPNSAYKISLYKNNNNEYAAFWLIGFDNISDFEVDSNIEYLVSSDNIEPTCRQIIYYGAPGTGKSHKIKAQLEGVSKKTYSGSHSIRTATTLPLSEHTNRQEGNVLCMVCSERYCQDERWRRLI